MNPSPDRGKECLPPKKRESRQGSAELPLDEFKPPVPLRVRPSVGRGEAGREASDRALTNPNSHFLHTPPPLPTPAQGLPLPLPWPMSYSTSVSLPLFPGQVGERRGSGSPAWRDDPLSSPLAHPSRWHRGDGLLSLPPSSSSASSFKAPFPADREMWSYINSGRRDYSSSLFSPSYLFSHHPLYTQEPSLDSRHRYHGKRPNGLDGPGSRTASSSRPLLGEYGNDSSVLDISPHSTHANGARRQQESLSSHPSGGIFLSDSPAQEGPEPHSSLQDRHAHGTVKSSSSLLSPSRHPLTPDARPGRVDVLDPLGVSTAEAQIYYSFGIPQAQVYPLYSPSGTPLYNLHREPGPRQHVVRNSPHSPLSVSNHHDRSQRDKERERDQEAERDRERSKDKDKHLQHKDQHRDSDERRRGRARDLSPSRVHASPPAPYASPPALLPHFTRGSLIELAGGRLKRVEELKTEDFLRSADTSPEFHLSTCKVLLISPSSVQGFSHLQVHLTDRNTQELLKVLVEYPFFVRDRGWSSCCPQKTLQLYGLSCRQLVEGDVCLALTPTPPIPHRARPSSRSHRISSRPVGDSRGSHREAMPPPPPPPPLPQQHPPPPNVPAALRPLVAEKANQGQSRPRKRRWSAPDTLPSTGTEQKPSILDLPHGSKLMKWQ